MACNLGPDFLCNSIISFRTFEDGLSLVLALFIIATLYITLKKIVKEGPLVKRLWGMIIGLLPFIIWKFAGLIRRVFLEKTHWLYPILEEIGEIMEGLAAIGILISLIYLYWMIKPKKK